MNTGKSTFFFENLNIFELIFANYFDFEICKVSQLMLSKTLLPLLRQSSKNNNRTVIANISAVLGSIGDNLSGGYYAYRASKTALNQVSKSMSVDLRKEKILVTMLHPGWVI